MTDDTITITATGSCLCGGVAFRATGARASALFCHCTMCRKTSGHYWAATRAPVAGLTFTSDDTLTWFASSDHARRGFCNRCGASLFYQPQGADHMGIAAGCLDRPTGLAPLKHIFTADAGDYYTIPEDAPHVPD